MASPPESSPPVAVVCVGMAGSGKTTFMQRINAHLHTKKTPPYVLNLDPAVRSVPFEPNIDIRDSVNYKEVMKQYNLGPNGGILTSLNLFATKIDQVLDILEKRLLPGKESKGGGAAAAAAGTGEKQSDTAAPSATNESSSTSTTPPPKHIIIDTPGQIEVFVWSASGSILLSALAASFPTVLAYVIDTPRSTASTSTFMSNMLYAISILYKTKLPMILVFNKTDVKSEGEAVEWMRDFESFQAALRREEEDEAAGVGGGGGSGYMGSLLNSMSLVLEEFYNNLSVVGVSSMTGAGIDEFFEAVENKRVEFEREYRPELDRRRRQVQQEKEQRRNKEVERMMQDMGVGKRKKDGKDSGRKRREEPETVSEAEEMSSDEEGEEAGGELVDPDEEEEDDDDDDDNDKSGLAKRYQQALDEGGSGAGSGFGPEDASFAKYIQTANINR